MINTNSHKGIPCSDIIKVSLAISIEKIYMIMERSQQQTSPRNPFAKTPFQVLGVLPDNSTVAISKGEGTLMIGISSAVKVEFISHIFGLSTNGFNFWNIKNYFFNKPTLEKPDDKILNVPINWFKEICYNVHEPQNLNYISIIKK
jgi:hypothetical protein